MYGYIHTVIDHTHHLLHIILFINSEDQLPSIENCTYKVLIRKAVPLEF